MLHVLSLAHRYILLANKYKKLLGEEVGVGRRYKLCSEKTMMTVDKGLAQVTLYFKCHLGLKVFI